MPKVTSSTTTKSLVCITGANGFIGSWLVITLLDHSYTTIDTSIFPGSNPSHLLTLPSATNSSIKILIHEADLLDVDGIEKSIAECDGGVIFYMASPCTLEDHVDPHKELVDPIVKGTLNVALKAGMRHMMITSLISAMVSNPNWPSGKATDEFCWTDLDYP